MAETKITVSTAGLIKRVKSVKGAIGRKTADRVGQVVIKEMKKNIGKGISPITGRRFKAYKDSYKDQIDGDLAFFTRGDGKIIPITAPKFVSIHLARKRKRPVNLHLSGEFLDSLDFEVSSSPEGFITTVQFNSELSNDKELGHREGANGQEERPIIPSATENFSRAIRRRIVDIYRRAIQDFLNKTK